MNTLVGKIFENRKNSERKVIIKDYQVSANDIEVVTIEFLDGCGKKAGTTENKFLKSFKKSWKETDEVTEEVVEEVIEEVEEEPEQVEEVVDTEKNLTDEDYAKIGLEIAEQAKEKKKDIAIKYDRKHSETTLHYKQLIEDLGIRTALYDKMVNCVRLLNSKGKCAMELRIARKHITVFMKDTEIDLSSYNVHKIKYHFPVNIVIDYDGNEESSVLELVKLLKID